MSTEPGKVRITSDGTPIGTCVTIDGKAVDGHVIDVAWSCKPDELATATIRFADVESDVIGWTEVDTKPTYGVTVHCHNCASAQHVQIPTGTTKHKYLNRNGAKPLCTTCGCAELYVREA